MGVWPEEKGSWGEDNRQRQQRHRNPRGRVAVPAVAHGVMARPPTSLVALGKPLLSSGPQRDVLPHLSSLWLGATYLGQAAEPRSLAPGHNLAAHPPARAADSLGSHPKRLQAAGQDFHSPHVSEGICPVCPQKHRAGEGLQAFFQTPQRPVSSGPPQFTHATPFVSEACRNCSTRRCSVVLAASGLERQLGQVQGALVSLGSPGQGGPVHLPGPCP